MKDRDNKSIYFDKCSDLDQDSKEALALFINMPDVIIDKIAKETGNSIEVSRNIYANCLGLNKECKQLVLNWINGIKDNYTFDGVSIQDIMDREKYTYIEAVFRMDQLMSDPKAVEIFKKDMLKRR